MQKRTWFGWLGFPLLFGLLFIAPILPAHSAGSIDGVLWYGTFIGSSYSLELVVRENRFNLTNHVVQATFRGTFETHGDIVRAVIDPRTTVFLDGPSRDHEKLSYIQQLVDEKKLDGVFVDLTHPQQGSGAFSLKAAIAGNSLELSFWRGDTRVGGYSFQTATPIR